MNRPQIYTTLPKAPSIRAIIARLVRRYPHKKEQTRLIFRRHSNFLRDIFQVKA